MKKYIVSSKLSDENPSDRSLQEKDIPINLDQILRAKPGEYKLKGLEQLKNLNDYGACVILSSGINTDMDNNVSNELTEEDKRRHTELKDKLVNAGFHFIEVLGNYGCDELSCVVIISDPVKSLIDLLNSKSVQKLYQIAADYKQDSILPVYQGDCCYLYTTGNNVGKLNVGVKCTYYEPDAEKKPEACFSKTSLEDGREVIFQHEINFDRTFENAEDYAEFCQTQRNDSYQFYYTVGQIDNHTFNFPQQNTEEKTFYIFRGLGGYNHVPKKLKQELVNRGIPESHIQFVSTDAHINEINAEIKSDKKKEIPGPKANWGWSDIRDDFVFNRNPKAIKDLIKCNVPVIGYCDMNKEPEFFKHFVHEAVNAGYSVVVCHVDGAICTHPYMKRHQ